MLSLLKDIEAKNGFDAAGKAELQEAMVRVERIYFADGCSGDFDLKDLAENWVRRASV